TGIQDRQQISIPTNFQRLRKTRRWQSFDLELFESEALVPASQADPSPWCGSIRMTGQPVRVPRPIEDGLASSLNFEPRLANVANHLRHPSDRDRDALVDCRFLEITA